MNSKILIAFLNADNFEKLSTNQYMYDISYIIKDIIRITNNIIEPITIIPVLSASESKL